MNICLGSFGLRPLMIHIFLIFSWWWNGMLPCLGDRRFGGWWCDCEWPGKFSSCPMHVSSLFCLPQCIWSLSLSSAQQPWMAIFRRFWLTKVFKGIAVRLHDRWDEGGYLLSELEAWSLLLLLDKAFVPTLLFGVAEECTHDGLSCFLLYKTGKKNSPKVRIIPLSAVGTFLVRSAMVLIRNTIN